MDVHGFIRLPIRFCLIETRADAFDLHTSVRFALNIFDECALTAREIRYLRSRWGANYLGPYNFSTDVKVTNSVKSDRQLFFRPFPLLIQGAGVSNDSCTQ